MPKLHLQVPTPTVRGRCTLDELVRDVCLLLSSDPIRSEQQNAAGINDPHSCGTNLGEITLISPREVTTWSRHADLARGSAQTFGPQSVDTRNLPSEVLEFAYFNLSEESVQILQEAHKPTIHACYAVKVKRTSDGPSESIGSEYNPLLITFAESRVGVHFSAATGSRLAQHGACVSY